MAGISYATAAVLCPAATAAVSIKLSGVNAVFKSC